ncbi:MAG: RNA polymerase sigma factor [Desulfobacterales bacterium]|nr:RNA polymerase sigma factor [Desulfobacterales bacterium]
MIFKQAPEHDRRDRALRRQMVMLLPRLRRFACNLAGDIDRGDELVQAACERALKRLTQFRDGSRLDSWMYRIIHTQWIDRLRRRKTRESHAQDRHDHQTRDRIAPYPARPVEAMVDVRSAMAALPAEQRAAISLVVVEGYTYAEAATILHTPAGTVASRVARARRELIRQLKNERPGRLFRVVEGAGGKDMRP